MDDVDTDNENPMYYVRHMNENDIQEVHALHSALFPVKYTDSFMRRMLVFPHTAFVLIDLKKKTIIGIASYMLEYVAMFSTRMKAYLSTFGIDKRYRNRCLATDLISVTIKYLYCYRLITSVSLHVQSSNTAAYNFYSKYGFVEKGLLRNYYTPEVGDRDAYVMQYVIRAVDFNLKNSLKLDTIISIRSMERRRVTLCEKFCY